MAKEQNIASSKNVELEIVHAVRGRVRLRLKSGFARELLPSALPLLQQQAGILRVQIKQATNSLVVDFDPDVTSIEKLTDLLQSFGAIASVNVAIAPVNESPSLTYSKLFALLPPLVGLAIARSLPVAGWKSIVTYILAAGVTREVIDLATGESEGESEEIESSPVNQVSLREVAAEEILPFLTAIDSDYQIVHHIRGRIRLRVPRITSDRNYAQELKRLLEKDNRITDLRLKIKSGSIVILYDPIALNESNTQKVDESASSTTGDREKPDTESDLNDLPPSDNGSVSDSETDTRDTLGTEAESTTPIADEQSAEETHQEFR